MQNGELIDKNSTFAVGDTLRVVIQGKGGYENSVSADFRIVQKLLKKATFKITKQRYTGSALELEKEDFSKAVYAGVELVYGRDYEIVPGSYKNNLEKGEATVVLVGKGQFGGRKTVAFKIARKEIVWWSGN